MDGTYNLNELSLMSGFTTRTLRTYLNQGLLKGEKTNGAWRFTAEEVDAFFAQPFVKEGLRIKQSAVVFDFLADRRVKSGRACVVLDLPASRAEAMAISDLFCEQMRKAADAMFKFDWDNGVCRVILSGAEDQVAGIVRAYYASKAET